jgi:FkbM family methyltransferase
VFDAFCESLPDGAVVVEAGAYHGEDTVRLADRVGFVHAFEPVSYTELEAGASGRENVHCWSYALGSENGKEDIWVSGGAHTASSSLLEPTKHRTLLPAITFEDRRRVQVLTLLSWAAQTCTYPIHGLWLDLQGMELAVLKAAGPVLDTVKAMVIEASHVELYEGCPLWPEVEAWLTEQGFAVVATEDQGAEQMNVLVARG